MLPPNGNPHDYLSWAPYHWPDCNWCNAKQAREEYLRNAWTTCPYAVRDGKVNPDVLTLTGSKSMVHMSQSVLYNAISYVIQGGQSFSQQASSFLDTFFLEPATSINPNVNFGQLVRGPGPKGRIGTFTGILDLRGMVKVVNAIAMLMYAKSPHWTDQKHAAMRNWMGQYRSWLETSSLGKEVASKPNNHASFYISQLAVTNIYVGDLQRAQGVLQKYFNSTFSDQIAISGEQPFEAVRTRPFHYRCFNLEAMITNAKLGDELGMNFWKAKSKYGATIQTAVDYAMAQNPKDEDVTELAPHVAAVAAAYGDPSGKYAAFLRRIVPDYQGQPFWYYDQAQALPNSPGARSSNPSAGDSSGGSPVSFQCPAVFDLGEDVEIDDGVFVTCDQLRPFYELPPVGA
ncbi:chondroitin AC/alginate lyase [Gloeophyllum trabeum ATCC 11539]|uniref:Chondroitin AC/alginate lyase n=1 Tax=Gloeophyllum trabeum (strain ATCC 11539 / FP-39264 / Madison 617) TaxID=670483 RepID=S7S0H2_GLOTA|nr:chondroitin AC/alginate lyase [Gloeophyllum trabeum ATCC 11539]EPQ60850.1 chondroitin AC/alginate lyase [Gloeophyllum trabeum ATCC 11539]